MKPKRFLQLMLVLGTLAPRPAAAQPFTDDEMMVVKPEGMTDRASITGKMSWCDGVPPDEHWERGRLRRAIGSREAYELWADAAIRLCEHADDPTWQKQAGYLVQEWMNFRNLSQEDAEKEIHAKILKLRDERAHPNREPTDEERFAFHDSEFTVYKPEDGADVAKIGDRPAWCDKAEISDKWNSGRIGRTVGAKYGIDGTIEGALHICQRPTDATWRTEAGYILQKWMNWSHLSQPEAEASLRARIQLKKFAADKEQLCKDLEVSAEMGGRTKAFGEGRRRFFGCGSNTSALWLDQAETNDDVGFYLDTASKPESELLRLYWLFHIAPTPWRETALPAQSASDNRALLYYAIAQYDFANIDKAALDRELSAAPYNDYARTVVMESLGLLRARHKAYEAAIDKLVKGDEDYANVLREAPKKAFAQWDKAAAQWKAEVERSNAFEQKLSSPSHKALKGCSPALQADAEKMVRSFKEDTYDGLISKIAGDPIAILLLDRLAICDAADSNWGASGALADVVKHGRDLRGPRSLAYYAILDALAELAKDRPRSRLELSGFWYRSPRLMDHYKGEFDFTGSAPRDPDHSMNKGVVASVTKVADGLQVTFKTQKVTFPDYACTDDTRHPLKINSDGRIEYYRNCKATGKMLSQDNTPRPIVISPALATGVKPGVFVVFADGNARSKTNNNFGVIVYTKKTMADKKLHTFFGFQL